MASNAENVSIWWRHHDSAIFKTIEGYPTVPAVSGLPASLHKVRNTNRSKVFQDIFFDLFLQGKLIIWIGKFKHIKDALRS